MHVLSFLFDRHRDKTVLGIAVALSIVLLALPDESTIQRARVVTAVLLYPVHRVDEYFASVERLEAENRDLRGMVAALYGERERLLQFRDERNRLRRMIGLKADSTFDFLPCEVIARSANSFEHSIVVDRGSSDGVRIGMTVVDYRGIVGRVAHVFPSSSSVYLINNKSVSVSCVNRRSRVVGILEWDQGNLFRLEYLGREEDVMRGDTLLTSGLGRLFPKGFPIGVVFQIVDDRSALAKRVNVVSAANLNALEELFIITGGRAWEGGEISDELEKIPAKRRAGRR